MTRRFPSVVAGCGAVLIALFLHLCPALAQESEKDAPAEPPPPAPASHFIAPQAKPKVIPRVLQRATPETTSITISLGNQRAWLFVDKEVAIESPVSSGKRAGLTPPGFFTILEKSEEQSSPTHGAFVDGKGRVVRSGVSAKLDSAPSGTSFRSVPMKYFMRLSAEGAGLHAGDLPGYPASHLGIRLPEEIARLFFENTRIGTPVTIVE